MPDTPSRRTVAMKYVIVDQFGDILWMGRATIYPESPMPEAENERALFLADAAQAIRDTTPADAPLGRVVILAAIPAGS